MIRTILNGVVFGLVVLLAGSGCLWPSPPQGTAVAPVALVPKLTPEEHLNNPSAAEPKELPGPKLLPPPSGIIVLKPGKVREEAESCPTGFEEVEGYGGWRFCIDPNNPEKIPPLWSPPIAGIPFEEALEIHNRHAVEFIQLPGVKSVGLGADGIHIVTSCPELIPKEVEGVPIIIRPPTPGLKAKNASHTFNTPVRPLHRNAEIRPL